MNQPEILDIIRGMFAEFFAVEDSWTLRVQMSPSPKSAAWLFRMKLTLNQVFGLGLLGLILILALLFSLVSEGSRATIVESSERIRDGASREISGRVTMFLNEAPDVVQQFQSGLTHGLYDPHDPFAVETALSALLFAKPDVGELTLTSGVQTGSSENGALRLAETPREQWSVVRATGAKNGDRFWSRHVRKEHDAFFAERREIVPGPQLAAQPWQRESGAIDDPTSHPTFVTPTRKDLYGTPVWSDLHWSQFDADLPEPQRRVEVSVQQVVTDAAGNFLGVMRVGLLTEQLQTAVALKLAPEGQPDPHRIFLCDTDGRLITRISPADRLEVSGDDLRISSARQPPEIVSALAMPGLNQVSGKNPTVSNHFHYAGRAFLTTFRKLPEGETQDWIIGIVVPRDYYLGKLTMMRNRLLGVLLAIILVPVISGSLILRSVKRAQAQITRESLNMNAFEFTPASTASAFRDVSAVLESLEKAKTAMRAIGKYAPIDLVRRLYQEKSEPVLGGEPKEITIMFSDIKNFTAFSEELAPNELAAALGRYLDTMARIIQGETGGTIDKYIGDAIMALWNAPEPLADHAQWACLAAVRCREAGRELAQTTEWRGLPPFETRFGLHCGTALVGHFGAPDRMNYTAIGDAINLGARLEGLNKHYGTTIIASEPIVEAAREHFDFRLLDLVAVKGRKRAVRIYELLGKKGEAGSLRETAAAYEKAFERYLARDFTAAIDTLIKQEADPPSAVLIKRCRGFLSEPPPPDWRGAYVSLSK
jgi:adenylate cyclase